MIGRLRREWDSEVIPFGYFHFATIPAIPFRQSGVLVGEDQDQHRAVTRGLGAVLFLIRLVTEHGSNLDMFMMEFLVSSCRGAAPTGARVLRGLNGTERVARRMIVEMSWRSGATRVPGERFYQFDNIRDHEWENPLQANFRASEFAWGA